MITNYYNITFKLFMINIKVLKLCQGKKNMLLIYHINNNLLLNSLSLFDASIKRTFFKK